MKTLKRITFDPAVMGGRPYPGATGDGRDCSRFASIWTLTGGDINPLSLFRGRRY